MIITNVDNNDLEHIINIQEAIFQEEPLLAKLDYCKHTSSLQDLKVSLEKYDFLKAIDNDGSIAGFICADKKDSTVLILAIMVKKERRNKGIGRKLVFAIEHLYLGIHCKIQTPGTIPKNIAFYESMGYSVCRKDDNTNKGQVITFEKLRDIH